MCLGPPSVELALELVAVLKALPVWLERWWTGGQHATGDMTLRFVPQPLFMYKAFHIRAYSSPQEHIFCVFVFVFFYFFFECIYVVGSTYIFSFS